MTKGGRRPSYRATALVGNRNGLIGYGMGKASDPQLAIKKAKADAFATLVRVNMTDTHSLFHDAKIRAHAIKIEVFSAPKGSGIIAGASARHVFDLAGYKDVVAKIHGPTTAHTLCPLLIDLLTQQESPRDVALRRGLPRNVFENRSSRSN